ncbi:MAG: hypothetical protein QOH97_431, partial [Actinoplanes sp.]|nr:hypothetical protein [Actinoplanes sp.]
MTDTDQPREEPDRDAPPSAGRQPASDVPESRAAWDTRTAAWDFLAAEGGQAEHELAEHELAEHELAEHELAEHELAEHELAEHELAEHELAEHELAE